MKTEDSTQEAQSLSDIVRRFLRRAFHGTEADGESGHEFKMAHMYSISEMERERFIGRRYKQRTKGPAPVFSRPLGVPLDAEIGVQTSVDDRPAQAAERLREVEELWKRVAPPAEAEGAGWDKPRLFRL